MKKDTRAELAQEVLQKRYFWPNENWEKLCERVARQLSKDKDEEGSDTQEYKDLKNLLEKKIFLPNTPCLINAGRENPQMSACYVLPIEDSIDSIFDTVKHAARIHKYGGGTGFDFSKLRPEGSTVGSTKGISSGPISFMKVFDAATQQMKQGGVRRGANMGVLRVDHPDIVKFIKCKNKEGEINNFNISVAITDEFMNALINVPDRLWECVFNNEKYTISNINDRWIKQTLPDTYDIKPYEFYTVKDIWDLIIKQSWQNGEPGVLFIDEIKRKNGISIDACNPCAELPLEPYDACCLGSIDVSKFFLEGEDPINWPGLAMAVEIAVSALNKLIDTSWYPLMEIHNKVHENRNIGLGIMGWADLLIKLKIKYGSKESLALAEDISLFIDDTASQFSRKMGYKNKTVTTIAPTGTISLIAECSSGIEPNFGWEIKHTREDFDETTIYHPDAAEFLENDKELPDYFVTAEDVSPTEHVLMQAEFQENVDNAISKTINMPNDATEEDVANAIMLAWKTLCKGITVYRDGSREQQVLSHVSEDEDENYDIDDDQNKSDLDFPEVRPYCLDGFVFKIKIDMGGKIENAYIIIGMYNGQPYEVFLQANIKEADEAVAQNIDTTTRLISLALRGGAQLEKVIEQLEKVPCGHLFSIPHKIAHVFKEFLSEDAHNPCPECGGKVTFTEGCEKCIVCQWSKCG